MTKGKTPEHLRIKRAPDQARYDREFIYKTVDAALVCFVGFSVDNEPVIIPMAHARDGDSLMLHGSPKGRLMKHLVSGARICVCVTLVDGLVMAKSHFNHSINYRSAILFGTCREISEPEEKVEGLSRLVAKLAPGDETRTRAGSKQEVKGTSLLAFAIEEASGKFRVGPPEEQREDEDVDMWTGVIPLITKALPPVTAEGDEVPENIQALFEKLNR